MKVAATWLIWFKLNVIFYDKSTIKKKKKSKVIPLHAMEASGVRGGMAPTHSQPRH
jgi:hypothetical protein